MKKNEPHRGFEQGPIRPPSESGSLLIRVTRNCPWNRCTFCGLYKNTTFSLRPISHVIKDIDLIRRYVERIKNGETMYSQTGQNEEMAFHAALTWVCNGMKSVFLQDSNSLIMKPDDLVKILQCLTDTFTEIERLTSYARSHTIARISDQDLDRMAAAGLNRIHVGMESASDKVLSLVQKGTDKAMQICAGRKVKQAGIQLSEYFIPGLGGKVLSREHALETADALNQINPDFIRLRTLAVPDNVELFKDLSAGTFEPMGDTMVAEEILLFIESLKGITSTVKSDHILNLFQEVEGTLPEGKEQMTSVIKRFLSMGLEEQMLYQIGRRSGIFSRLDDLSDPRLRRYAERNYSDLKVTPQNVDRIVAEIMKRFI
ncbi:MAG: radical SAM protein [Deltaproteobacteria bacterium]|nr:radical SAM protein [Deltaproteobacteria bacterium]